MSIFSIKKQTKGAVLLAVVMLGILLLAPEGITETRTVTLVHTNNVTGHLFACPS